MFSTNRYLSILDLTFIATEKVSKFDYVEFGEKFIIFVATISAVIVGFSSYVYTALQLWWEDNNETILTRGSQFIIHTMNFAHEIYTFAQEIYSVGRWWWNRDGNKILGFVTLKIQGV